MSLRKIAKTAAILAALALALSAFPTSANADLLGSQVTGTLYYPDLSTIYGGPLGPYTVTGAVEFPTGTLAFDGDLDVTGTQVIWTATLEEQYGGGSFNGFVLDFAGAPGIASVTVDGASTMVVDAAWSTPTRIYLSVQGDHALVGQQAILDVEFAAPTPEPTSLFLIAAGLLGMIGFIRKRSD